MSKKLLSLLSAGLIVGSSYAQESVFPELDVNLYDQQEFASDLNTILVPKSPIQYDVLFIGGTDAVYDAKTGQSAIAKEWQDFTGYVPIDNRSDSGYVIVNHERLQADAILGDGGGMTVMTVYKNPTTDEWEVVRDENGHQFRNVDFTNVGGTAANCGGIQTNWGQVFTAEEWGSAFNPRTVRASDGSDSLLTGNQVIFNNGSSISDTSDFNITQFNGQSVNLTVPKFQNFQYMVEVDVESAVAVRKNYNMGRYDHEGGWIAEDERTVYLSDDKSSGSVLFKFVATTERDFSEGQLYAYKQSADGESGEWLTIPMTLDAMINARDEALDQGATIFMRLEWVEGIDGYVYITETGRGKTQSVQGAVDKGGVLAHHLKELDAEDGTTDNSFTDLYGRVLRFDPSTNKVDILIEGGGEASGDDVSGNHLSSPDGLASTTIDGRTYLVINEDMNPSGAPANPAHFDSKLCEIYVLDITDGETKSVSDLSRFAVGPKGCETTGGRFTPDGLTYFVNIQHPDGANTPPFNHSVTLAISGYKMGDLTTSLNDINGDVFSIYPNPVSRELHLNAVMDVAVYNSLGERVLVERGVKSVDISNLSTGNYIIKNTEGDTLQFVVQ